MDTVNYTNMLHTGRKIERIRRLRGMTQTELGEALGITKQAVSKMEQTEQIDDDRLKHIAEALGVTEDGLKNFHEERVIYNTNNFYENCQFVVRFLATIQNCKVCSEDRCASPDVCIRKEHRRTEIWRCVPENTLKSMAGSRSDGV